MQVAGSGRLWSRHTRTERGTRTGRSGKYRTWVKQCIKAKTLTYSNTLRSFKVWEGMKRRRRSYLLLMIADEARVPEETGAATPSPRRR